MRDMNQEAMIATLTESLKVKEYSLSVPYPACAEADIGQKYS